MDLSPSRRKRYGEEGEGLFHDNDNDIDIDNNRADAAPVDPYMDEFHDEDDGDIRRTARKTRISKIRKNNKNKSNTITNTKSPILLLRRNRWKKCAMILACLVVTVVVIVIALTMGGGGNDDDGSENNKGMVAPTTTPAPAAPTTPAPVASTTVSPQPTPAPTNTFAPTITAVPTRSLLWTERMAVTDSTAASTTVMGTGELMGSSVDISADGSVVWIGAFNYTHPGMPESVGRIRRLDVTSGEITEVYGTNPKDSLGYQVSGSGDGEFVAGFASTNGMLTVWDYMAQSKTMRVYATTLLPSVWDYFTVIFDLSKDGKWLAVTGTEITQREPVGQGNAEIDRMDWKLRIYEIVTGSGGDLVPVGPEITIESDLTVQPELYALDISEDGSVVAAAIVGVKGSQGRVRVFQRQGSNNNYVPLGNPAGELILTSQIAAGTDDFYGRRLQVRTVDSSSTTSVWLAIGWESQNTILVRRWNAADSTWESAGEITPPGDEFDDTSEFGYDFDVTSATADGPPRMIIGVRCFNDCQGATQMFQLNNQGVWESLGQILVGYEDTFFGEAGTYDFAAYLILGLFVWWLPW